MNDTVCEKCGLKNSASAQTCARCDAPLEGATQVTQSPFMQTVIDLPILPTPAQKPRVRQDLPASARPTAPLAETPLPGTHRRPTEEVTRVVRQVPQVPADARPEPTLGALGRPAAHRRPVAQDAEATAPLPQAPQVRPRNVAPKAEAKTAIQDLFSQATEAIDLQKVAMPRASLRERLSARPTEPLAQAPSTQVTPHNQHGIYAALLRQHAAALAIDGLVLVALVWLVCVAGIGLSAHGYPAERPTAFENLALWLARSGGTPLRCMLTAFTLVQVYVGLGALWGHTVGRAVMGLVLVDPSGRRVGFSGAFWHALGGTLSTLALGGGMFWFLVDPAHRTWASLLSHTQVVPRHQVVPR